MRVSRCVATIALLAIAVSATSSGTGACLADGSNSATCCKPEAGKYCTEIKASQITNVTQSGCNLDGNGHCAVCMWANLAGQTPDSNAAYNTPYINNFACGGTNGDCNAASTSAIADNTGAKIYYGIVPSLGENITNGATSASTYWLAFNRALSRYNCEEQYSHWNCDDCRKAYARWACAMTMPACTAAPCEATKPCVRVCNEVVQKCPVTLGFTCPDDNRDYSESGCNHMGLSSGAGTLPVSFLSAVTAAVLSLALARQD